MSDSVTADMVLAAYANGYFPMAESADSVDLHWFHPEMRGIIPLETFHISRSLARFWRKHPFIITIDKAFPEVMQGCAKRDSTWINERILALYTELWQRGHAHSVECWMEGKLIGGVYGVVLGGAFFGESMFSRVTNASKIALVTLVEQLKNAGYTLFDAQYVNEHLKQFGIMEIPRKDYQKLLKAALAVTPKIAGQQIKYRRQGGAGFHRAATVNHRR